MMKLSSRLLAATLSLVAAFAVISIPHMPASASDSAPSARDYHAPAGEVRLSGEDQCALPLDERQGAWICLTPPTSTQGNVCTLIGCYYYATNYKVEFRGSGTYGYGGTRLGDGSGYTP